MVRDFNLPLQFVLDELPINQALALAAWNAEASPYMKRMSDGYLRQDFEL